MPARTAKTRRGFLCGSTVAICLVLAWSLGASEDRPAPVRAQAPGSVAPLPAVQLLRADGELSLLRELYPDKAIVLNVWATWCPPCRSELPSLQRLSDSLDPERFVVVGISVDEDGDFVREYLRDVGITFANYLAADNKEMPARLGIDSFPQTLLADPNGTLQYRVIGARDWSAPKQRKLVQTLWSLTAPGSQQMKQGEGS